MRWLSALASRQRPEKGPENSGKEGEGAGGSSPFLPTVFSDSDSLLTLARGGFGNWQQARLASVHRAQSSKSKVCCFEARSHLVPAGVQTRKNLGQDRDGPLPTSMLTKRFADRTLWQAIPDLES